MTIIHKPSTPSNAGMQLVPHVPQYKTTELVFQIGTVETWNSWTLVIRSRWCFANSSRAKRNGNDAMLNPRWTQKNWSLAKSPAWVIWVQVRSCTYFAFFVVWQWYAMVTVLCSSVSYMCSRFFAAMRTKLGVATCSNIFTQPHSLTNPCWSTPYRDPPAKHVMNSASLVINWVGLGTDSIQVFTAMLRSKSNVHTSAHTHTYAHMTCA